MTVTGNLVGHLAGSITTAICLGQPAYRDEDLALELKEREADPYLIAAVERWNDRARTW